MGRQVISKTRNDDNVNKVKTLIINGKSCIFGTDSGAVPQRYLQMKSDTRSRGGDRPRPYESTTTSKAGGLDFPAPVGGER
jgi:hypothetical protein